MTFSVISNGDTTGNVANQGEDGAVDGHRAIGDLQVAIGAQVARESSRTDRRPRDAQLHRIRTSCRLVGAQDARTIEQQVERETLARVERRGIRVVRYEGEQRGKGAGGASVGGRPDHRASRCASIYEP